MGKDNIEKIAKTPEDKLLLAKLWDKVNTGILRNTPANSRFLTPHEQEMAQFLFGAQPGLVFFGGYADSERKILCYIPDYLDKNWLHEQDSPIVCLRASFYYDDTPSHRDFLGALMGAGIARDALGDICVDKGSCDFFVLAEVAPFLMHNFTGAGHTKLQLTQISTTDVHVPEPELKQIKDTLASLRLDSVISSGFRIGRSLASQYISTGRTSVNGVSCEKPDKTLEAGVKISVRGLGKIRLTSINGQTKKGRISVVIDRYL